MKFKNKSKIVKFKNKIVRLEQRKGELKRDFNKRINEKFYKKAIDVIRKNNLSKRKFNKRDISPSDKRIITSMLKQRQDYINSTFIKINKLPNESDYKYKKRLKNLQGKWNQSKTYYNGIFISLPDQLKNKIKYKLNPHTGEIISNRFTPNMAKPEETTKEIWIPYENDLFDKISEIVKTSQETDDDRMSEIDEIFDLIIEDISMFLYPLILKHKPTIVIPVFNVGQSDRAAVGINSDDDINKAIDIIIDQLRKLLIKYVENIVYLSGFIFRFHYLWGNKINVY